MATYYLDLNRAASGSNDGTDGNEWATFSEVGQNQTLLDNDIVYVEGSMVATTDVTLRGNLQYRANQRVIVDCNGYRFVGDANFIAKSTSFLNFSFFNAKGDSTGTDTAFNLGNINNASSSLRFESCYLEGECFGDQAAIFGANSAAGGGIIPQALDIVSCHIKVKFPVAPTQAYRSNGIFAIDNTAISYSTIIVDAESPDPLLGANFIFGVGGKGSWSHGETEGCSISNSVIHGNNRLWRQYGSGAAPAAGAQHGTVTNSGIYQETLALDNVTFFGIKNYFEAFDITAAINFGPGIRFTTWGNHGLFPGATISVAGVEGATGANGTFEVTSVTANLVYTTSGNTGGTYTSGGRIQPSNEVYLDPQFVTQDSIAPDYRETSPVLLNLLASTSYDEFTTEVTMADGTVFT
jgi:hypothetical protein